MLLDHLFDEFKNYFEYFIVEIHMTISLGLCKHKVLTELSIIY